MLKTLRYLVAEGFIIVDARKRQVWLPAGKDVIGHTEGILIWDSPNNKRKKQHIFSDISEEEFGLVKQFLRDM